MKRSILLVAAVCLSVTANAQKPKRMFSTEKQPLPGVSLQTGEQISLPDGDDPEGVAYVVENVGNKTYLVAGGPAGQMMEGGWLCTLLLH